MSAHPELAEGAEPGPARLLKALVRGDAEHGREPLAREHLAAAAALALALEAAAREQPSQPSPEPEQLGLWREQAA